MRTWVWCFGAEVSGPAGAASRARPEASHARCSSCVPTAWLSAAAAQAEGRCGVSACVRVRTSNGARGARLFAAWLRRGAIHAALPEKLPLDRVKAIPHFRGACDQRTTAAWDNAAARRSASCTTPGRGAPASGGRPGGWLCWRLRWPCMTACMASSSALLRSSGLPVASSRRASCSSGGNRGSPPPPSCCRRACAT